MTSTGASAGLAIAELIEQVGRAVHGDGFSAGLNPAQWAALRFFGRANRFSRTVSAFADFHGSTRGTASQTVKSLVGKGLLCREPVPTDRRSFLIGLTDAGRLALSRDPLGLLVDAVGALPAEQQGSLAAGLDAVLGVVLDRQCRPRFGVCACCCHLQVDACPGSDGGAHLCGLLVEPLDDADVGRICTNYRSLGAEPARR